MPWIRVNPVVTKSRDARSSWCRRPYPRHPKGCPNYGKKSGCPPCIKLFWDFIKRDGICWAIYNAFDIAAHADRMRSLHPDWSDAQVYCCLYWQPRARRQLSVELQLFRSEHRGFRIVRTPEASGVKLTPTMKAVGIELEWPPRKVAYQIMLAGEAK